MFKIAFAFGDEFFNYDLFASDPSLDQGIVGGADPILRVEDVSADVTSPAEDPWLVASANLDLLPPDDSTFDAGLGAEYEDPYVSADSGRSYDDPFELVAADSGLPTDTSLLDAGSDGENWGLPTDTSLLDAGSDGENWGLFTDDSSSGGGTEPQYLAQAGTCNGGEISVCSNGYYNSGPDLDYYEELYPAQCMFF